MDNEETLLALKEAKYEFRLVRTMMLMESDQEQTNWHFFKQHEAEFEEGARLFAFKSVIAQSKETAIKNEAEMYRKIVNYLTACINDKQNQPVAITD